MKKIKLDRIVNALKTDWKRYGSGVIVGMLIAFILTLRLGRFTPGVSSNEAAYIVENTSFSQILKNPDFLHHRILGFISHQLGHHGILAMRLISVLFGLLAIYLFYTLIRKWHTRRIALMSLALFASSSWFLTITRHAGPYVMYLLAPLVIYLGTFWLIGSKKKKNPYIILFGGLFVESMLFVPFMAYLFVFLAFLYRKQITTNVLQLKAKWQGIVLGCWFVGLSIFALAAGMHANFAKEIFGLSPHVTSFHELIHNGLWTIWGMFVKTEANSEFNLGTLPLIDAVGTALIFLGAYFYLILHKHLRRTYALLLGGILLAMGVIYTSATAANAMLMPLAYVGIAAGLTTLLGQWFTVFPRNPIARSVGVSVVTILVSLTSLYHLSRYFIAFRYAPETKAIYSMSLPAVK